MSLETVQVHVFDRRTSVLFSAQSLEEHGLGSSRVRKKEKSLSITDFFISRVA